MISNVPAGVLSESLGHARGMALGSFIIGIGALLTAAARGTHPAGLPSTKRRGAGLEFLPASPLSRGAPRARSGRNLRR